mmetsp:Transcript_56210/g.123114  ORF Transcript_56210/g.123114 Transcript_56210/m.123114 type:complete len:224 (+) Transcript_56210:181-852(+)
MVRDFDASAAATAIRPRHRQGKSKGSFRSPEVHVFLSRTEKLELEPPNPVRSQMNRLLGGSERFPIHSHRHRRKHPRQVMTRQNATGLHFRSPCSNVQRNCLEIMPCIEEDKIQGIVRHKRGSLKRWQTVKGASATELLKLHLNFLVQLVIPNVGVNSHIRQERQSVQQSTARVGSLDTNFTHAHGTLLRSKIIEQECQSVPTLARNLMKSNCYFLNIPVPLM